MKMDKELIDKVAREVAISFTRNGLAGLGFDTTAMVYLQAAMIVSNLEVKQVGEKDFGDCEIVVEELIPNWTTSQLTTRAGIKKLVAIIVDALRDPKYSESTIYENSTKVQIIPNCTGQVIINLIYPKERND